MLRGRVSLNSEAQQRLRGVQAEPPGNLRASSGDTDSASIRRTATTSPRAAAACKGCFTSIILGPLATAMAMLRPRPWVLIPLPGSVHLRSAWGRGADYYFFCLPASVSTGR